MAKSFGSAPAPFSTLAEVALCRALRRTWRSRWFCTPLTRPLSDADLGSGRVVPAWWGLDALERVNCNAVKYVLAKNENKTSQNISNSKHKDCTLTFTECFFVLWGEDALAGGCWKDIWIVGPSRSLQRHSVWYQEMILLLRFGWCFVVVFGLVWFWMTCCRLRYLFVRTLTTTGWVEHFDPYFSSVVFERMAVVLGRTPSISLLYLRMFGGASFRPWSLGPQATDDGDAFCSSVWFPGGR